MRRPRHLQGALRSIALALVLLPLLLAACASSGTVTGATTGHGTPIPPTVIKPAPVIVQVYFSKYPDSLNNPAAVSRFERVAPTTAQVETVAVQLLIAGPTPEERAAGSFSELNGLFSGASRCAGGPAPVGGPDFTLTLNMKGGTPEPGTATLQFCRPISSPGIGADARAEAELEATLRQFSTIQKVVVLTVTGHCFGDESGQDRCLQ